MTDTQPPAQFDWATELSEAQGHVTLSAQEAKEIGARLRSMGEKLRVYEDLGAAADVQLLRTGYDAARLEVESLHAQLEAIGAGGVEPLRGCAQAAPAAPAGEIVVTKNEQGQIVAVTRQDKEGRVLSIVAESSTPAEGDALDTERLDWLTFNLSGKALRDIGVLWSEYGDARRAIDAAMAAQKGGA